MWKQLKESNKTNQLRSYQVSWSVMSMEQFPSKTSSFLTLLMDYPCSENQFWSYSRVYFTLYINWWCCKKLRLGFITSISLTHDFGLYNLAHCYVFVTFLLFRYVLRGVERFFIISSYVMIISFRGSI